MPPKPIIHDNQGEMFNRSQTYRNVEIPVDPETMVPPEPTPETFDDGPSVNIQYRAQELLKAFELLGQMSSTNGLDKAASGPHRQELEKKMDNVDEVVGRSLAAQDHRRKAVQHSFARASGMGEMIQTGFMSEDDAKKSTREDFAEFLSEYSGKEGSKARAKKRSQLRRTKRIPTGSRLKKT